jgi:hypothetical protein
MLATEGEELLRGTSQPQTLEALFLAMVIILSCQVCGTSGETYWAYFPDSSILHPASRNDTGIKLSANDTALLGGSDSSHIPYQWPSFNYSARSFSPPLCLSWNDGIACLDVQLTTQISSALGSQDDFTELYWHTIIKMGFPSHYSLEQGPPGAFLLVLIWMKSFMDLLLGWIVHTQHLG